MAFTRALDDTRPNGALVNASQLDEEIRAARVDYHERLSAFFDDPDVDPPVMKAQANIRTTATGKVRYDGFLAGDTYTYESAANVLDDVVGNVNVFRRTATGAIVTGTLNVSSTITGNLTGNLTGNVTGNVTGNLTGNVTGNVSGSAATLLNTRTIWGQNFNGSGNVSGVFSGATTGAFSSDVTVGGIVTVTGTTSTIATPAWAVLPAKNTTQYGFTSDGYTKDAFGFVSLQGTVTENFGTGAGEGDTIATLTAGNRPLTEQTFFVYGDDFSGNWRQTWITVQTDGQIRMYNGSTFKNHVHLDGIRFRTY